MISKMCIAAANYLIKQTNDFNKGKKYSERISMTCKRLQKLLYFSEIEYMKTYNGEAMFTDDFHAWPSGPVIPSVYDVFVQYQNGEMRTVDETNHSNITDNMKAILKKIFEETTNIDTYDLVEYSHISDGPWAKVYDAQDDRHEQVISKQEMIKFYQNRAILSR